MQLQKRSTRTSPTGPVAEEGVINAVRHWWRLHPRLGLTVRIAFAGGLAWFIAQLFPGVDSGKYAYFAPMGAVVVSSHSVIGTVRELSRSLIALALGGALGLAAVAFVPANALGVAAVIGVGVLLSGWRRLATMRGWVPIFALFTMVLGRDQPLTYVAAYIGLSAVGAAVGVAVVAVLPQLLLQPLEDANRRLWLTVIERLREVRDDLQRGDQIRLTGASELGGVTRLVADRLSDAEDAARGKPRLRGRTKTAQDQRDHARAMHLVALRANDVIQRMIDLQPSDGEVGTEEVNGGLVDSLDLILEALRNWDSEGLAGQSLDDALQRLEGAVEELPTSDHQRHAIGASAYDLRRLAAASRDAISPRSRSGVEV